MNKSLCVISCPIDTYSGYGARSRDLVKAIIELKKDEWDIKILPQRWGDCSWDFVNNNPEWMFLKPTIRVVAGSTTASAVATSGFALSGGSGNQIWVPESV